MEFSLVAVIATLFIYLCIFSVLIISRPCYICCDVAGNIECSVLRNYIKRNGRWLTNDELERMWKEATVS
jgi:hypothetical protein